MLQVNNAIVEFSADDCKMLGFNKANLLYSIYEHFAEPDPAKKLCIKMDLM